MFPSTHTSEFHPAAVEDPMTAGGAAGSGELYHNSVSQQCETPRAWLVGTNCTNVRARVQAAQQTQQRGRFPQHGANWAINNAHQQRY